MIFFSSLNTAISQSYVITGNIFFSQEQIRETISKIKSSDSAIISEEINKKIENLNNKLYSLYHSFGFFDCNIKTTILDSSNSVIDNSKFDNSKSYIIKIDITESERFVLDKVKIKPDSLVKIYPKIFEPFTRIKHIYFNYDSLENIIKTTLTSLDSLDFPLAKCEVEDYGFIDNFVEVTNTTNDSKGISSNSENVLLAEKNQLDTSSKVGQIKIGQTLASKKISVTLNYSNLFHVKISEFNFVGNKETSASLIKTASGVNNKDNFKRTSLQKIRARISRLNIFNEISLPELYSTDSGNYGLEIKLVENNTNSFDGILGIAPEQGGITNSGTKIFGSVKVGLKNISGTGRNLMAKWESLQNSSSELSIEYQEPFIFNLPFGVSLLYSQFQKPATTALTSYVQRKISLNMEYFTTENFSISAGTNYDQTIPQPDSLRTCYSQLIRSNILSLEANAKYDSRNNRINPMSGLLYSTTISFGFVNFLQSQKCYDSTLQNTRREKIDVNLAYYKNLYSSIVGVSTLNFGSLIGEFAQESDLYNLGGQATVRGYKENQFKADSRVWANLELRMLLSDYSFIGFFFDAGYFLRKSNPIFLVNESEAIIYGYGFNAQIESGIGLVRFSFSIGKDDKLDAGKIFFGLVSEI